MTKQQTDQTDSTPEDDNTPKRTYLVPNPTPLPDKLYIMPIHSSAIFPAQIQPLVFGQER